MNGNSIPPGYRPNDELWNQPTEVFEAVGDEYLSGPDGRGGKSSQATKYAIIGLSATIAIAVLAIGGLLLSGHGGWNAAPNSAGDASTPRVVLTPANPATTTPYTVITPDPGTSSPSTTPKTTTTTAPTTTTTTVTATNAGSCDQPGQTAVAADGMILTCNTAGESSPHWRPNSKPSSGAPCNANEAGTFATAASGTQLVCTRQADTTAPSFVWLNPGTVTTGKHDPGQACNLKKDVVAQSSSGRAIYCMPTDGANSNNPIGAWKFPS
ncbi:hypothetical protein [Nocardia concava]|uniref:hypothetical protein n=1 Tax=Nocardia concava TaxID=257281 RepID=UPI0002E9FA1A|nr:hypothetical protein [Nocardia concava]